MGEIMDVRKDYVELEQKLTEANELIERYVRIATGVINSQEFYSKMDTINELSKITNRNGGSDEHANK